MTNKEALESLVKIYEINKTTKQYKTIKQDLERLEVLERNSDKVIKDSVKLMNRNFELQQQNEKLKKALESACKILSWDCPCSQDLIDDLDCENRCQPDIDYSECWMKYLLKEVLGE